MQPNQILQADALDILFENRNKTYGAYPLRRGYSRRLAWALGGVLAGVALIFLVVTVQGKSGGG
ncbi:MAG TPA: energy transducer TonB, partial [Phnomibacter sp.]|nr:energy transducer TonB [Phnomibacter sp.]